MCWERVLVLATAVAVGACSERPLVGLEALDGGDEAGDGAGGATGGSAGGAAGAAGGSAGAAPAAPLAWVEVPGPPDGAGEAIFDAWSAGPDDVFFVGSGYYDAPDGTKPWGSRLLRWTAAHGWQEELRLGRVRSPARAVSGSGPNDVWTAGDGHLYHRDAVGWRMVPDADWRPEVEGAAGPLIFVDVAARPGSDEVWFAAPKFLLHRTAGRWSAAYVVREPMEAAADGARRSFDRLWLGRDVWVSGIPDALGSTTDPAFISRVVDGALVGASVGLWPSAVTAAWPTSGGGFWFAEPGFRRDGDGGGEATVLAPLRHYDGDTTVDGITQAGGEENPLAIRSLWGRADDDVWAAGAYDASATPVLFHYDGHLWSEVHDAPPCSRYALVTGDAASTWLVTEGPRFFRKIRR
jgi:hypothetical protein